MEGTGKCILESHGERQKSGAHDWGMDLCHWRSDEEMFIRQQTGLAKYFRNATGPVIDLGCGRGTMLELLRSDGITSYGIDSFSPALEVCRGKGLPVTESDIFSHLDGLSDSSVGGIFCSHVIEHLQPPEALRLIRESYRVLSPGGTLVLVTPNPRNLLVLTETFWLDITHVRFYPGRLLQPLLIAAGFSFAEYFEDKYGRYSKVLYRRIAGFIRHLWFWGLTNRGDVIVVARK